MRLFVAVRPPEDACSHLAAALGRAVDPKWHVTLVFLGEQESDAPFDLTAAVQRHAPFPLRLAGVARLGDVVGAGMDGDVERLQRLAHDVRRACRQAGAVIEHRRYKPHLTLGRGKTPAGLHGYVGPDWTVGEVELVRSTLGRPVVHDVLRTFPLRV